MATRTVKEARGLLKPGAIKARVWGIVKRKATFGWTKAGVAKQLVTVDFCGLEIRVHKKIVPSLASVQEQIREIEKKKKWPLWKPTRVDTFNWRPVRGGTTLSRHAHGIALDIDPRSNKYYLKYTGYSGQTTDIPVHVFQAFKDHGWTLGIEWDRPLDVMHVQYC